LWRLPSQPGKLPSYVQSSFRVKTFGLLSAQLAIVLVVMVLVDIVTPSGRPWRVSFGSRLTFWVVCMATLAVLLGLHFMRDVYPANYVLLAIVTLLQGLSWGLSFSILPEQLHFQLMGTLFVAVLVTTFASAALSQTALRKKPWTLIASALLVGWVVGTAADIAVAALISDISMTWAIIAAAIAFGLLLVLLGDAGRLLVRCDPDDVMKVIVAMDSALLVVVSIPIFIVSECCLHAEDWAAAEAGVEAAPEEEAGAGGAPVPEPNLVGARMQMEV
jgi:FtsH-binding integral membrane protein